MKKILLPLFLTFALCLSGQSQALVLGQNKPASFADTVEPLLPSTVNIWTTTEVKAPTLFDPSKGMPRNGVAIEELFRQFLQGMQQGQARKSNSLGSGFLIAQEGKTAFIVTCNHVIAKADEIKITLHDGMELDAKVVGRDKRTDLALLSVQTDKKLTVLEWGDSSKARVGDRVIAIGNPFGLGSTVTTGIISSIARDISSRSRRLGGADYVDGYIQTDASINMGNSGGALFDIDGNVIAVSTAIYTPNGGNIGIGFGIPSSLAKKVIAQLKEFGRTKRGWLGVRIQNVTDEIAETLGLKKGHGALVGDVVSKGPGQKAGLQTQDVILSFNGKSIKESKELPYLVGESKIGETVPMVVWRGGKKITLNVAVGEWEKAEKEGLIDDQSQDSEKKAEKTEQTLGLVTRELTSSVKQRYSLASDAKGLFVAFVSPSSKAFQKFMRPGDIIQQLTAGSMKITPKTPKDLKGFVKKLQEAGKSKVLLLVNTKGNLRYVALDLTEKGEAKNDAKDAEKKSDPSPDKK